MEWLISFVESPYCSNLLFALLHSLWQGALIAGLLYLFFRTKFLKGENVRYNAGLVAMATLVLCVLFTFSILNFQSDLAMKAKANSGVHHQEDIAAMENLENIVKPRSIDVQRVSEKPLTTSPSSTGKVAFDWKPLALILWFAGVIMMLMRALYLIAGGAKLRSECNALNDDRILAIIESLRERMKITRKIRVAVSDQISIPGVIGFFRSVLFLPASMLGGMPADALEAILAHELAHVKRYDYLVNFCQMVVEAMLFFNPAVWWISRQIRIEREVCCDHAGINAIGRRVRYAEILVGWAQKLKHPDMELSTAAMGFGAPDPHGSMAERIKRIVAADHRPGLKAPWHLAGMTLLLSLIAIGCLWMGADVTVAVAGKVLSTQERMDRIAEISQEYGYSEEVYGEEDEIRISGSIRTWDGSPLPENTSIRLYVEKERARDIDTHIDIITDGLSAASGTYDQKIDYGTVHILIAADGYASIKAGPFQPEPGGAVEGLEYVLQKGYPATIKVVDENNEPVEGVEITGNYTFKGKADPSIQLTTDDGGIATMDNAADLGISLAFDADGFEPYETGSPDFGLFAANASEFILKSDEVNLFRLTSSKETNGIVISKETGEPVEGALFTLVGATFTTANGSYVIGHDDDREPETATDENGEFRLRKLNRDGGYTIRIEAEGYMCRHLTDVRAGMENIVVELGPEKKIKGKILGDLGKLEKDEDDTPFVTYSLLLQYENGRSVSGLGKAKVAMENGAAYFEIEKFPGPTIIISAGDRDVTVNVDEDDLENVLVDLSPEDTREVVFKFDVPEDEPDIEGMVWVHYDKFIDFDPSKPSSMNVEHHMMGPDRDWLEIIDNQVRMEVQAPGTFNFFMEIDNGDHPVTYWFESDIRSGNNSMLEIPAGDDPYIIEIPVSPAGAIYGAVRGPDGTIVEDAQISVQLFEDPQILRQGQMNSHMDTEITKGTFNATPLPLGGKYGIIAYRDKSFGVSELIEINEKNPIVNLDVEVPEGVDIHGQLVDADNNPVRIPVALNILIERGKILYHDYDHMGTMPDQDGRFVYKNVNPGPYGNCKIDVQAAKGYQSATYEIDDLSEPIIIQLKEALRVTGVVIDEETGLPVSGVTVLGRRRMNQNGYGVLESIEAEKSTNEKGEFVLTGMGEGIYDLELKPPAAYGYIYDPCEITVGQDDPIIFKVNVDDGSDEL